MSSRSYLSIGDVLTLLRQEFPDVTISKIRFLESQGLVNPERTPSGYRKFYEHDVERLRWVLRQQREHFLPLKVIKDRLDDDPVGPEPAGSQVAATPGTPASAEVAARSSSSAGGNHSDQPVLVGQRVSSEALAGSPADVPGGGPAARAAGGPMLPGIETSYGAPPAGPT
ncbi:MAG: MerR family transcriptional regulator, partial [Acidimicrobiales bacterium]